MLKSVSDIILVKIKLQSCKHKSLIETYASFHSKYYYDVLLILYLQWTLKYKLKSIQVSLVDSWFLSLSPVKRILLRMMKQSNPSENSGALQRRFVYSFGDHYYFRKELQILNLLTGYENLCLLLVPAFEYPFRQYISLKNCIFNRYVFLLDKFGRIRWQGFGAATEEELSSLLSCTSNLLEEK